MGGGRALGFAIALAASPGLAAAQTASSPIVPQSRADQAIPTARDVAPPANPNPTAQPGVPAIKPFQLTGVVVEGSTLPVAKLRAAWAPFVGQSIDGAGLAKVSDAVVAAYKASDIALYTVLIPNQDFQGGVLRVRALEGYIDAVAVEGGRGEDGGKQLNRYLAKLKAERPLTKRTLQRYVSLIRDLPGMKAEVSFANGGSDRAVRMVLRLHLAPVQAGAAINNRGAAFLGRTQAMVELYLNGLLDGGDQTHFTLARPTDGRSFQYYSASHLEPLGGAGATVQLNLGYLKTRPKGVPLRGEATSVGLQLSHPLVRSYDRDVYLTLGLDGLNSNNALLGVNISDERTRALRAGVSYKGQAARRQWFASGAASFGLDALGARTVDPALSDVSFVKWNLRGGYNVEVVKRWVVRLNAASQWTNDRLPPSEQFALGGNEYGRAYEAAVTAGDYGYAGSVELAFRPGGLPRQLDNAEVYGFIDGGRLWYRGRLGFPKQAAELSTAGFGLRAPIGAKSGLQLELARALPNGSGFLERDEWRGVFALRTLQ